MKIIDKIKDFLGDKEVSLEDMSDEIQELVKDLRKMRNPEGYIEIIDKRYSNSNSYVPDVVFINISHNLLYQICKRLIDLENKEIK